MRINKLLRLSSFGFFYFFIGVLNILHAQNQTCATAIEAEIGNNSATNTPDWYSFEVPMDMDSLIVSSIGYTTLDTKAYIYSGCENYHFSYNDDAQGTYQTYIKVDVSNYRGETIYIRWELFSGTGGVFDWLLSGIDEHGRTYKFDVGIEDFTIWYGEKIAFESPYNTLYPIQYMLEGPDNGTLLLDGDSVEGLAVAGTQQVVGVIYDDFSVNRGQKVFTVTTQVDPSGKKTGMIYDIPESIVAVPGEDVILEGVTNSDATIAYSLVSGSEYGSLTDNVFSVSDDIADISGDETITLEANISETEEYTAYTVTFEVSLSAYINSIPYMQYRALEAIYAKNNGQEWSNQVNWFSEAPVDDWYGLTTESRVDEFGNNYETLTELNFYNNSFNNELADEIQYLSDLVTLRLGNCNIKGLPTSIRHLSNLKILDIDRGTLSVPEELGELTTLETLVLENVKLEEFPESLLNLTNLQVLNLRRNEIYSVPEEIGTLSNLEALRLESNNLSRLPSSVVNLSNLSLLNLSSNNYSEYPSEINAITTLTSLDLSGNDIKEVPAGIGNLTNLVYLKISGNPISSLPSEIGNLTNLEELRLYITNLQDLPSTLSNCTNLWYINIDDCKFENIPTVIGSLPALSYLYIDNNKLNFEDLDAFSSIFNNIDYVDYAPQNNFDLLVAQTVLDGTTTLINTDVTTGNVYEWYKDDELISGATSSSLTYAYDENIGSVFYCKITNPNYSSLTLNSNNFTERGELLTLIVENIPENTPEGSLIYAVGNLTEEDSTDRSFSLVLNEASMNYELVVPKTNFDTLDFYFTTRKYSEFSEINNNGEFFRREIVISSLIGQSVIDDIVAWNSVPSAPNTCEESINTVLDSTYVVDGSPRWYKFTAGDFMDLDISFLENEGSKISIFDGCNGNLLVSDSYSYAGGSYGIRLLKDQEIFFKVENYYGDNQRAFKIELSATYLKEYLITSVPENTPEDAGIYATQVYEVSEGYTYLLNKLEGTSTYQLILNKTQEEINLVFKLNDYDNFC